MGRCRIFKTTLDQKPQRDRPIHSEHIRDHPYCHSTLDSIEYAPHLHPSGDPLSDRFRVTDLANVSVTFLMNPSPFEDNIQENQCSGSCRQQKKKMKKLVIRTEAVQECRNKISTTYQINKTIEIAMILS